RKIEDEPFFGNLKANLKYLRTSVRGIEKVTTEAGIAIMAANLLKLTLKVNVIFRKSIVKKIIVVFRFNISLKTTIILFCVAYVPATCLQAKFKFS
ncbi:transposase, partial [Agrilactobacillus fermenti]